MNKRLREIPPLVIAKWVERGLWAVGLVALLVPALFFLQARVYQAREKALFEHPHSTRASVLAGNVGRSGVLGKLDIPRLHLSTMVREGTDDATLRVAVGHISETPLPWEPGNVALAGHRDTFFRSLERIRKNDLIRMTTLRGTSTYRVESFKIVDPEDVSVLDASAESVLTLVTCYPFVYVGSAPCRFIVRARRVQSKPVRPTA